MVVTVTVADTGEEPVGVTLAGETEQEVPAGCRAVKAQESETD
jgi:hypothetical protein